MRLKCGCWIQSDFSKSSHANTWRAFLGKKNEHSATLPGTQMHGTVSLWFCSSHFSSVEKRGQCSRSIICNLKGPQVPGVVIQHDYWNYTVTLIALIAQQLIKHAGFQTQKDKIGDFTPSFLLAPAGCLWWKILLHLRRVLPIFFPVVGYN